MKAKLLNISIVLMMVSGFGCKTQSEMNDLVAQDISVAEKQIGHQVEIIEQSGKILNPRTLKNNKVEYVPIDDWTSGFFPGTMWYMYDLTKDEKWKKLGIKLFGILLVAHITPDSKLPVICEYVKRKSGCLRNKMEVKKIIQNLML